MSLSPQSGISSASISLISGLGGTGLESSARTPIISAGSIVIYVLADGPSATFTFTTDIASGTGVEWGTTVAYGTAAVNPPESVTSHSITVNQFDSLPAETDLHARVAANNSGGTGYSADLTLSTKSFQQMSGGFYFDKNRLHAITPAATKVFMMGGCYMQEIN